MHADMSMQRHHAAPNPNVGTHLKGGCSLMSLLNWQQLQQVLL